jgi:hypothetical protein
VKGRNTNPRLPEWEWNGSEDAPTFSPSIRSTYRRPGEVEEICHSYVRAGQIEFLPDSTHALRGQTVALPAFEDGWS